MNGCCPHEDRDHQLLSTCQEVIHYPSEDYPCLCTGWEGTDRCVHCGHRATSHVTRRVCKPADGSYCDCGAKTP